MSEWGTAAMVMVAVVAGCSRPSTITQEAATTPSGASASANASADANANANAKTKADADAKAATGVKVILAGQDSDALSVVRTERLRAKAEGRVLVVYAGAGWCEPCKRFKSAIQTGALDDKLAKTTLLVFDADRDTERLAGAGYTFQYIPYVAVPGADGRPSDSAQARAQGSESWRDLVAKLETWQAKGP